MKEFLDLDKRDREILSLLEKYPEMSQSDMAEKLNISQPSISSTLEAIVDGHLRSNPLVKSAELSIVITTMKDFVMPIKMNFDFSSTPPCGNGCNCKDCSHHISNRCLGCPVTNSYNGKIWK